MAKRKRKQAISRKSTAEHTPEINKNQSTPESDKNIALEQKSISKWIKMAVLFTSLVGVGYFANEKHQKKPETNETSNRTMQTNEQVPEINEIILGNTIFYLDEYPQNFSKNDRINLFNKMKNAHEKLSKYFGADLVTLTQTTSIPVNIDPNWPQNASINTAEDVSLRTDGVVTSRTVILKNLTIREVKEKSIAHEMVHIFLQKGGFSSFAYTEGQAHAIEEILYKTPLEEILYKTPLEENPTPINYTDLHPHLYEALNMGLDYRSLDISHFKGGIKDPLFSLIIKGRWKRAWIEFESQNPGYFKKFYQEIANLNANNLSKDDLVKISQDASPNFQNWYSNEAGIALQDLTKNKKFEAIIIPEKREIIIINFQTNPAISTPLTAMNSITIVNTQTGKTKTIKPKPNQSILILSGVPNEFLQTNNLEIIVDGQPMLIK